MVGCGAQKSSNRLVHVAPLAVGQLRGEGHPTKDRRAEQMPPGDHVGMVKYTIITRKWQAMCQSCKSLSSLPKSTNKAPWV